MKSLLRSVAVTILLLSHQAAAIVDIEKSRRDEASSDTQNIAGLAISGKHGNINTLSVSTSYELYWGDRTEENLFLVEQTYAKSHGQKSDHDFLVHSRKILHLDKVNAVEYYGQYQNDRIRGLKDRGLVGANVRLKRFVIEGSQTNYLGFGVFFFKQFYTKPIDDLGQKRFQGFRGNLYWSHKRTLPNKADINATVYVQPKLNDLSDIDVLVNVSYNAPITNKLFLKVSGQYSHLDTSPLGFKEDDIRYYTGLSYTF